MKKLLSLFMSAVMLISCTLSVGITAIADEDKYKLGIDVSVWDGSVEYVTAEGNIVDFVMIRLGYYNHLDKYFWENVEKLSKAGIDFGVYLYSYAYSTAEAEIEANFVIDTLAEMPEEYLEYFTLPVAYDMEDKTLISNCKDKGWNVKKQLTRQLTTFCDKVEEAGYTPMVYSNLNWLTNYLDFDTIVEREYKIWYAYWLYPGREPDFSTPREIGSTGVYADIWQYQSGEDDPSGFDRNVAYDLESLKHRFVLSSVREAECAKKGRRIYKCTVCGAKRTVYTPSLGHTYETTKATLSKDGYIKCTRCDKVKSEISRPRRFTLSQSVYTYDGTVKNPEVTVLDNNGEIISAANYTLSSGTSHKLVGKQSVKITFKGKYDGTKTLYFTIRPKSTSISSATAGSKKLTVKIKKQPTQTTGYQIQYATNSSFNSPTNAYVKNTVTSKTIKNLKGKKKYYIRVRTYKTVNGTKYYSVWSKPKTVTTKR